MNQLGCINGKCEDNSRQLSFVLKVRFKVDSQDWVILAGMDVVTDRLFRHLAWANTYVFDRIAEQPEERLKLTAPNDTWTVAEILEHLTASRYADLLDGKGNIPTEVPTNKAEVLALRDLSLTFDQRLREAAKNPVGFVEFTRWDGKEIRRNRETILTQSIHHATEHRAQIAGIFANHGLKVIDLDAIDLWEFANYEGLGD